jgi:hypothetical protein
VSILTKISAGPNSQSAHGQVMWEEPDSSDSSVKFDVWIRDVEGQPSEEIEKRAMAEAVRVAKAFIAFCDKGG